MTDPYQPQQPYDPNQPQQPYSDPYGQPQPGSPAAPYGSQPGSPAAPYSGQPYTGQPYTGQEYGSQQPYGGQYSTPQYGAQGYGAPQYPAGGYPPPQSGSTNVMAILSLVFAFVFAPVGIVLGHLAKKQIKERGEQGGGLATAGLVLSYIFTSLTLLFCCIGVIGAIASSGSGSSY
ncbi:DUF4190 domain-containing protein [Phytohabitans kaempferiae]|uniref:DUF4190 domain-containing protein n=1 Tax=Phytohabitans kaempferiae TaxID=1620943 RepID=A0ABV6M0M6_9ACTN